MRACFRRNDSHDPFCAFASGRLLASFLFAVSPYDPVVFTAVAVVLLLATLVACLLPARRATRVDPMIALRAE